MTRIVVLCFMYALLNVSGAAIIKSQLIGKSLGDLQQWVSFILSFKIILALTLVFLSALILFKALSSGQFTLIIPVSTGINFVLTVLVGYFLFRDPLNYVSFIGFALIFSGIVILSLNAQHAQ